MLDNLLIMIVFFFKQKTACDTAIIQVVQISLRTTCARAERGLDVKCAGAYCSALSCFRLDIMMHTIAARVPCVKCSKKISKKHLKAWILSQRRQRQPQRLRPAKKRVIPFKCTSRIFLLFP